MSAKLSSPLLQRVLQFRSTKAPGACRLQALKSINQSSIHTKSTNFFSARTSPLAARQPSIRSAVFRRTFTNNYAYHIEPSPSSRRALWAIMSLNAAVFGLWQYGTLRQDRAWMETMARHFTLSGRNLQEGRWYTVITAAFSHVNLFHFGFNMVALHAFGSILLNVTGVGGVHVISLCVGSAVAGSVAWLYHTNYRGQMGRDSMLGSVAGHMQSRSSLGASGMVLGAGAAATCLVPRAPMMIFPIPMAIPLWLITFLYVAADVYWLDSPGRVGHSAHLGGAVYGFLFYWLYLRKYGAVANMLLRGFKRF